jgi:hypothetical protein
MQIESYINQQLTAVVIIKQKHDLEDKSREKVKHKLLCAQSGSTYSVYNNTLASG